MREAAKRAGLVLASTLLAVAAAEVAVRATLGAPPRGNLTPVPAAIRAAPPVPELPYVLRPGAVVAQSFPSDPRGRVEPGARLTDRINTLGLRGPETTRAKPAGVYRIAGLGDSFTFGTGVRDDETFLAVLERRANAAAGRRAVEALNFGVMGYSTAHEVALLRHVALGFEPDLVLLCFFANDGLLGTSTAPYFNVPGGGGAAERWLRRSALLDRALWAAERRDQMARMIALYQDGYRPGAPGWEQAQAALREARALTAERGVRLVLVIFPVLWRLSGDYPFADVHRAVAAFAAANGIDSLDLLPAFAGHDGPELWVHPTNQHPNEVGHAIAGEAIARHLAGAGLLPR